MVVHLFSPDNRYNPLYVSNYAMLNVRDELSRLPGIASIALWGRVNMQCEFGLILIKLLPEV